MSQTAYRLIRRRTLWSFLVAAALMATACGGGDSTPSATAPSTSSPTASPVATGTPTGTTEVILATTTSTVDSGLLDTLLPEFEKQTGYTVKPLSLGSGQALETGARGEADVLLVHSPKAEEEFMAAGNGINRTLVMHNDFVIVGPADDPAGIKGTTDAAAAMKKIAAASATFVSRGDDSGTNALEKKLWEAAAIDPEGQGWYLKTGQGMAATLMVANEKDGYTISDRGTYLSQKANLALAVLVEGDKALLNVYHVIMVNPAKHPDVNQAGAQAFLDFLVAPATQEMIAKFGVDKYGQALFIPDAGKE